MHSLNNDCHVDGCDAARRSGSIFCGGHWGRLSFECRRELSRASRMLDRHEAAIGRSGWTAERQDAVDEAAAALLEAQRRALEDVEARETIRAAA